MPLDKYARSGVVWMLVVAVVLALIALGVRGVA